MSRHTFTDAALAEHNAQIEKSVFDKAIKQVNNETLAVNLYLAEALEKRDAQVRAEIEKSIRLNLCIDVGIEPVRSWDEIVEQFHDLAEKLAKAESALFEAQSKLAAAQLSYEASHRHHVICLEQRNALQGALRKAKDILEKLNTDDRQQPWVEAALAAATALLEDK